MLPIKNKEKTPIILSIRIVDIASIRRSEAFTNRYPAFIASPPAKPGNKSPQKDPSNVIPKARLKVTVNLLKQRKIHRRNPNKSKPQKTENKPAKNSNIVW